MKAAVCLIFAAALALPAAQAQQGTPLFSAGISDWTALNTAGESFRYDAGVLHVSGKQGWLRSPREYTNFELRGQVRFVEANADSGIFLRVHSGTDFIFGWPGAAYQVQLRDISVNQSDNPLPLAHLYRHRVSEGFTSYKRERVLALYTGVGTWQDLIIRANETTLTVELNGELVTETEELENLTGYIGFQSEAGRVEYRNMVLHEF